jgi:hypothetical protein
VRRATTVIAAQPSTDTNEKGITMIMTMTCSTSALRPSLVLRSTMLLLLASGGLACVVEEPPPDQEGSGTTTVAADSSTGSNVSVTSTTGGLADSTTTTASEPATTSSSGATDETAGVFIMTPDGGVCVFEGVPDGFQPRCTLECDIAVQDCPRDEKCMPWANDGGDAWNATRCSPIPENPAGLGEPCMVEGSPVSGIDDCDLGLLCFGVDPRTLQGTCTALCDQHDETSCGPDEVCVDYDDFAPFVCLPRCDPFDPGSCAAGETCRQIDEDLLCVPDVVLPQGLDCGADEQYCAPDQACQPDAELGNCTDPECCSLFCDLSAPNPDLPCFAMPAELCRPFFDEPPPGYEHVGVCGLPI